MPYLKLPNGSFMQVPEGVSEQEAMAKAQQAYPKAFMSAGELEEKQGFGAALKDAGKGFLGSTAEGLGELTGIEALKKSGERTRKELAENPSFMPTDEEDVKKAQDEGLLSGLGAMFRQKVSEPVGGIIGRYAIPTAVGAVAAPIAGALGVGGAGATIAGLGARALIGKGAMSLADAPAEISENLQRQRDVDTPKDLTSATSAGLVQAALAGFGIPGLGKLTAPVQKMFGAEANVLAKEVVAGKLSKEAAIGKLNGTLKNVLLGTGEAAVTGAGLMVGTEALRRGSAGQGVADEAALKEYGHELVAAAELAPLFGVLHGAGRRGSEKKVIDAAGAKFDIKKGIEDRARQDAEAVAAAAVEEKKAAFEALPKGENAPLFPEMPDQQFGPNAPRELNGIRAEAESLLPREREQQAADLAANTATPFEINRQHMLMKESYEALQQKFNDAIQAKDYAAANEVAPKLTSAKESYAKSLEYFAEQPEAKAAKMAGIIKKKTAAMDKAASLGEVEQYQKIYAEIEELKKQLPEKQKAEPSGQGDLFAVGKEHRINEEINKYTDELDARGENADRVAAQERTKKAEEAYQARLKDLEEAYANGADDIIINRLLEETQKASLARVENKDKAAEPIDQRALAERNLNLESFREMINEQEYAYKAKETEHRQAIDARNQAIKEKQPLSSIVKQNREVKRLSSEMGAIQEGIWTLKHTLTNETYAAAESRPEIRRDKALEAQKEALGDLHVALQDLAATRRPAGPGTLSLLPQEGRLEAQRNKTEALNAIGKYVDQSIKEVNAIRDMNKQKPLTNTEAINMAKDIRSWAERAVNSKNPDAVKIGTGGVSPMEKQLAQLKSKYHKGESRFQRGEQGLRQEFDRTAEEGVKGAGERLRGLEEKIHALEGQVNPDRKIIAQLKQAAAKERVLADKERAASDVGERRGTKSADENVSTIRTERETQQAQMQLEEQQALGGKPPIQKTLFGDKELGLFRATTNNFMRMLRSASVQNIRAKFKAVDGLGKEVESILSRLEKSIPDNFKFSDSFERLKHIGETANKLEAMLTDLLYPEVKISAQVKATREAKNALTDQTIKIRKEIEGLKKERAILEKEKTARVPEFTDELTGKRISELEYTDNKIRAREKELKTAEERLKRVEVSGLELSVNKVKAKLDEAKAREPERLALFEKLEAELGPRIKELREAKRAAEEKLRTEEWNAIHEKIKKAATKAEKDKLTNEAERLKKRADEQLEATERSLKNTTADREARAMEDARENLANLSGYRQEYLAPAKNETPNKKEVARAKKLRMQRALEMGKEKPDAKRIHEIDTALAQIDEMFDAKPEKVVTTIVPENKTSKVEAQRDIQRQAAGELKARKERTAAGLTVSAKKSMLQADAARAARDAVRAKIAADAKHFADLQKRVDAATGKKKENVQKQMDTFAAQVKEKNLVAEEQRLSDAYNEIAYQRSGMETEAVIADQRPVKSTKQKTTKQQLADINRQEAQTNKKFDLNTLLKEIAEEGGRGGSYSRQYSGPSGFDMRVDAPHTGERLDPKTSKAVSDAVEKNAPKDVVLKSVESFEELPEKIKAQLVRDGFVEGNENTRAIRGFVTPEGEVYVIRGNHKSIKDMEATYVHELVGHAGVDRLLGEKGMTELTKRVEAHGGAMELAKKLGVEDQVKGALDDYALGIKNMTERGAPKEQIDKAMKDMESQAVRELIAYTAEKRVDESFKQKAGRWIQEIVGAVRQFLRDNGFAELSKVSTADIYNILRQSQRNYNKGELGGFRESNGQVAFRNKVVYADGFDSGLQEAASKIYLKEKSAYDRIKAGTSGMTMMTRFVDRFAPLEYIARTMSDKIEGVQMMYYNRLFDQRNNMMGEIATHGAVKLFKNADGTHQYKSRGGPSLKDVFETAAKSKDRVGDGAATTQQFGLYLAAERAASNSGGLEAGLTKLSLDGKLSVAEAQRILDFGRNDKNFQEARKQYREYNDGMLDLMVETGRLSKEDAAKMKGGDYVPYYRERNGEIIDTEHNIKVGDLKTQAYLKELVGGDSAIVNFETGALQNTYMLTDMAMGNIATKNTAYTLQGLGLARIKKGDGAASPNVIRFYENGEKKHAIIETSGGYVRMEEKLDKMLEKGKANTPEYKKLRERAEASRESEAFFGNIPAELIVKGMEGVATSTPLAVAMMRGPANLLRQAVTRNPAYAARVAFKDSLSGWITSGADVKPIVGALGNLKKSWKGESPEVRALQEQGIIGGHVFAGTMSDMRTVAQQIAQGKTGWEKLWAKADRMAIVADESARLTLYNGFVKKGMSPMEATLATLESQNFTKHGYSPSMKMLSTMIPFFNAQVQGLNTFARAFTGSSLFEDKLGVKQRFLARGAVLSGMTMIYAALMQNNEAYKNATEEERAGYWFIPLPGFKEPLRVPIPFEAGIVFKALPEAMFNLAMTDSKSKDVLPALGKQVLNSVPGMSNMGLPQGIKPVIEIATNTNFFTGNPIESQRQRAELPGYRYSANTTELSKMIGKSLGISPVMMDHFISSTTSSTGIALASMFNPMLREVGSPEAKTSQLPIIGGFFQPTDGSGLINKAYEDMQQIEKINTTYKRLSESNPDEAERFLDKNMQPLEQATAAGSFKQQMGELNKYERSIMADKTLSAPQKRRELDEIKQMKIDLAKEFMTISRE